jgi:hypothetical protein
MLKRWSRWSRTLIIGFGGIATLGCQSTPIDLADGPARQRMPRPEAAESYEDSLTGGEVFSMYCNQCHNARALGERPFANYQNVAAHMRVRANFTGKEYAKLMEFLRRWHDVPSPTPPVEPSPKRLIFGQPIAELREEPAGAQRNQAPAPANVQPAPAPGPAPAPAPAPGPANAPPVQPLPPVPPQPPAPAARN